MEANLYKLEEDLFEKPKNLVHDYKKYGYSCFTFIILTVGSDWRSPSPDGIFPPSLEKMRPAVKDLRSSWPFEQY